VDIRFSRYQSFTTTQFAEDNYFQQWVIFPLPEDETFWAAFFAAHPECIEPALQARLQVLRQPSNVFTPLTVAEKQALKSALLEKIQPDTVIQKPALKWMKIAAAVSVVLVFTVSLLPKNAEKAQQIVTTTAAGETKKIVLADSTVVILNAGSTLSYASNFGSAGSRLVKLAGNAFFTVTKKPDHQQFLVQTKTVSVVVWGTAFNVNARNSNTEIVLAEGKVELQRSSNQQAPEFMQPGDKMVFDSVKSTFEKSTIDPRLYQAWNEHSWHFSSTSLQEISGLIAAYYGVETVFPYPKMKGLKINGVIPVTDLPAFVQVIAKTLDIHIIAKDNQLIVQH
jgi:transmembrane sensor